MLAFSGCIFTVNRGLIPHIHNYHTYTQLSANASLGPILATRNIFIGFVTFFFFDLLSALCVILCVLERSHLLQQVHKHT